MADELTYSDIVEEVATPETTPPAENVKVYLNDGNDFLQMGLEDFEDAYNISDLRDRIKKGTGGGAVVIGAITVNEASGAVSTAEGGGTKATASCAHAEGGTTTASGGASHAEGQSTVASGDESHAEGGGTRSMGTASHAEGGATTASGSYSHAEGQSTVASGDESHAEGGGTQASGDYSHAEGRSTFAGRKSQHVFGEFNAIENGSGATKGNYVEIVGNGTADTSRSNARTLDWQGNETLAGKLTVGAAPTANMDVTTKQYVDALIKAEKLGFAFATCPTAEATVAKVATCSHYKIAVNGFVAVRFDYAVPANATLNINSQGAHEIYHKGIAITAGIIKADDIALFVYDGSKYQLLGINRDFWDLSDRIAKGTGTQAVVEGNIDTNVASGDYSHAEGREAKATGNYSHAEGNNTEASALRSHAEGFETKASGSNSHSEGIYTKAVGGNSHAEGYTTESRGRASHAEGYGTIATNAYQHVFGCLNIQDPSALGSDQKGSFIEIVGNGTDSQNHSNARTLDWNGNEVLAGKLTVGAAPTADMDVATKKYVDDLANPEKHGFAYAVCSTERHIDNKTATLSGYTIKENAYVSVKFDNEIVGFGSRVASLNINSQGAHDIYYHGSPLLSGFVKAGDLATFIYADGKYHLIGVDSPHPVNYGFVCGNCNESASETAKTVWIGDGFQLTDNGIITVIFAHAVPANSTLNVGGTGAIPIYFGDNSLRDGVIGEKCMATFMYHSNFVGSSPHWLLMSVQAYGTNA